MEQSIQNNTRLTKVTLVLSVLLALVMPILVAGVWVTGLEGINPENQGKVAVYPISDDAVTAVKLTFMFLAPVVSLLMVILSITNIKRKRARTSWIVLALFAVSIAGLVLTNWLLTAEYVSRDTNTSSSENSTDSGTLQIKNYQLR